MSKKRFNKVAEKCRVKIIHIYETKVDVEGQQTIHCKIIPLK